MIEILKADGKSTDGLAQLEWIEFRPAKDGKMEVNYRAKGPVEGCLLLTVPQIGVKPQPSTGAGTP